MPIYTLPQDSGQNFSSGVDQIFIYVAGQIPIFIPSLLIALFMIVWIGGSQLQRKLEGTANYPQWFAIAGYMTTIIAMVMMLIEGLIPLYVVGITLAVSIIGSIWFFTSKD